MLRNNRNDAEKAIGCLGLLIFGGWLAFWGAVIYVAWHFISKLW